MSVGVLCKKNHSKGASFSDCIMLDAEVLFFFLELAQPALLIMESIWLKPKLKTVLCSVEWKLFKL